MEVKDITDGSQCFQFDKKSRSAFCCIKTNGVWCRKKITNNHSGNKFRHIRIAHPDVYTKIQTQRKKKKVPCSSGNIQVTLTIDMLYSSLVELITKNGRPFSIVDDSGMRILINAILDGIHGATGEKYVINTPIIKEKLCQVFSFIKQRIIDEIHKKPISIIVDIATKHNTSILGINISCRTENGFILRTIGMEPLTVKHTARNIHGLVKSTLNDYKITPNQVISYSSDNAWNVINVQDILNEECEQTLVEEGYNMNDNLFAMMNDTYFGSLLRDVESVFDEENEYVQLIPCGAHTLQLALNDALKTTEFASEISFAKDVVKQLRTPTMANILRTRNLKQALLDHEIRWNFTYQMV